MTAPPEDAWIDDSGAASMQKRPVVLLIDDDEDDIPRALTRAGFQGRCFADIAGLERYLKTPQAAIDDPLAALVDVGLDPAGKPGDWGLGAVVALRRSAVTRRTGIILRSNYVKKGGEIKQYTKTDLHAVLCAAACRVGVLVAAKNHEDQQLTRSIQGMASTIQGNPKARFAEVERGGVSGGLTLIEPVFLQPHRGPAVDIVEVLLGNEAKRSLWQHLEAAEIESRVRTRRANVLETALRKVYAQATRPSRNLDSEGQEGDRNRPYAVREFFAGQLGDLSRAWRFWNGFLSESRLAQRSNDDSLKPAYLTVPATGTGELPNVCWQKFQSSYLDFLAHSDVQVFGEWYMEQSDKQ